MTSEIVKIHQMYLWYHMSTVSTPCGPNNYEQIHEKKNVFPHYSSLESLTPLLKPSITRDLP